MNSVSKPNSQSVRGSRVCSGTLGHIASEDHSGATVAVVVSAVVTSSTKNCTSRRTSWHMGCTQGELAWDDDVGRCNVAMTQLAPLLATATSEKAKNGAGSEDSEAKTLRQQPLQTNCFRAASNMRTLMGCCQMAHAGTPRPTPVKPTGEASWAGFRTLTRLPALVRCDSKLTRAVEAGKCSLGAWGRSS